MADDDWRITIELEEEEHATGLLEQLGGDLGAEAQELAKELEARRLAVSRDDTTIFVYAATRPEAEKAHAVIEAELRDHDIQAKTSLIEHWLDEEERWDDEPPGETWEQEELDRGVAPWESSARPARKPASSPSSSRRRGTSPSAASSTSSSAPRPARTRMRWQPASTARSRWAERWSSR